MLKTATTCNILGIGLCERLILSNVSSAVTKTRSDYQSY